MRLFVILFCLNYGQFFYTYIWNCLGTVNFPFLANKQCQDLQQKGIYFQKCEKEHCEIALG